MNFLNGQYIDWRMVKAGYTFPVKITKTDVAKTNSRGMVQKLVFGNKSCVLNRGMEIELSRHFGSDRENWKDKYVVFSLLPNGTSITIKVVEQPMTLQRAIE